MGADVLPMWAEGKEGEMLVDGNECADTFDSLVTEIEEASHGQWSDGRTRVWLSVSARRLWRDVH